MKKQDMKKAKDAQQRSALAGWDNEGGTVPSDHELTADTQREESRDRAAKQEAADASHDSSARGEHRYPDAHQTEGEQIARGARDALKRKLGGTR